MTPPDLLLLEDFNGDWNTYVDELYRIFMTEVTLGGLRFRNRKVNCRRKEETFGRWASFWHLTQHGPVEEDRLPDLRRCERIRWVRWTIETALACPHIDEWQNRRGEETSTLLWYREEYLVVLAERKDYWLLKTAYCTDPSHRGTSRLRRERDDWFRENPGQKS